MTSKSDFEMMSKEANADVSAFGIYGAPPPWGLAGVDAEPIPAQYQKEAIKRWGKMVAAVEREYKPGSNPYPVGSAGAEIWDYLGRAATAKGLFPSP